MIICTQHGQRYSVDQRLDGGGFGRIFQGVDQNGSPVVLKVLRHRSNPYQEYSSWANEVNIGIRCINHPYLVQIKDRFAVKGNYVIVMERAQQSLYDIVLSSRVFTPHEIVGIGLQILAAVQHLHDQGILHRDITPKNILSFANSIFKLGDFGVSKNTRGGSEWAKSLVGCKPYIPPELWYYHRSFPCSDIYQVGLVLLELCIKKQIINPSAHSASIRDAIFFGVPLRTAHLVSQNEGELGELGAIISCMVAVNPNDRYRTADGVIAALSDLQNRYRPGWLKRLLGIA